LTTTTARRNYRSSRNLPPAAKLLQVPVRGREDAGVADNLLPSPDPQEALLLECRMFDLDRHRQLTDLIQESIGTRHINDKRAG
jgi:hypothetical protein